MKRALTIGIVALMFNICHADPLEGDANCSGSVNITDVVALINYIFGGIDLPECKCDQIIAIYDSGLMDVDSLEYYRVDTNWIWVRIGNTRIWKSSNFARTLRSSEWMYDTTNERNGWFTLIDAYVMPDSTIADDTVGVINIR